MAVAVGSTSAATTAAAAGTGSRQLLTGLLEDHLGVLTWTHHPHQQVVGIGGGIQEQRWVQTQPAVDQLLLRLHRHSDQFRLRPAVMAFRASGSRTLSLAGDQRDAVLVGRHHLALGAAATATTSAAAATTAALQCRRG